MIHYSTSEEIKACRAFALERNRQMFEEAQALSRSAFALLEGSDMDVELFDRYQAMRRKADLKFEKRSSTCGCSTKISRLSRCPRKTLIVCSSSPNPEPELEKPGTVAGLFIVWNINAPLRTA